MLELANIICLISAISSISKSHIHIVTVLANLNTRCDDSSPDKPLFFKKAMASLYWKNFEKTIHVEFQFLIENDTLEYKNMSLGRAVLTGR